MILTRLREYYQRLEADPNADVVPAGWSRQKVSFRVVLHPDGKLHAVQNVTEPKGNKQIPVPTLVPGVGARSGTKPKPNVLWDNAKYLFGYVPEDDKPHRTAEAFAALRDRHLELRSEVDDPGFDAVCRFLENWDPAGAADRHPELAELPTGFGVFGLVAEAGHVHDRPAVRTWWNQKVRELAEEAAGTGPQCLISGESGPIARRHKLGIKGIAGAPPGGRKLVSFNFPATESYGLHEGENGPVGEAAAFQYAVALNRLLDRDRGRRVQVGNTTVVFWAGPPPSVGGVKHEGILATLFDPPDPPAEDDGRAGEVGSILAALRTGECPPELGEPGTPFYVLGLSPNAARLSVRLWRESTLGDLIANAHRHFADLKIVRSKKEREFPPVWMLLGETARESKEVPPLLSGALLRSILDGSAYPAAFLAALVRRTRADRDVRAVRAGAIKACLSRDFRLGRRSPLTSELPVALDPDRPEPAYHLGRLFAVLEKTQEDALPGINATIKDRYFGAASATPGPVFPRLIRMNQHHAGKLENPAFKTVNEKRLQEIVGRLDGFPPHLSLPEQGLFAVGYYHQRQDLFTSKSDKPAPDTPAES